MYEITSNVASDILTADFYAFSSTRSVLFYVKNNVLYAYNYDKGNERVETIPLEIRSDDGTDERCLVYRYLQYCRRRNFTEILCGQ